MRDRGVWRYIAEPFRPGVTIYVRSASPNSSTMRREIPRCGCAAFCRIIDGRTELSVLQCAGGTDLAAFAFGERVAECGAGFFGGLLKPCNNFRMLGGNIVLLADVGLEVV